LIVVATLSGADNPGLAAETALANRFFGRTALSSAANESLLAAFAVTRRLALKTFFRSSLPKSSRLHAQSRQHRATKCSAYHAQHFAPRYRTGDQSRYIIE
jgi:hypothetical protein